MVQSRDGTHGTIDGEIMRSNVINRGPGTSEEDSYASKARRHSDRRATKLDPPIGNFLPQW